MAAPALASPVYVMPPPLRPGTHDAILRLLRRIHARDLAAARRWDLGTGDGGRSTSMRDFMLERPTEIAAVLRQAGEHEEADRLQANAETLRASFAPAEAA